MGEAIITSRSAAQEEAVPVVPGYHSILATVRDYQGKLLKDYPINCKDGSVWYNYKTNETGKVLFTCNSGAANISINNVIDGYRYLDFPNHIINCDCPIGGQTRLAFNIPKTTTTNFSFGAGTSKIRFLHDQECSGYIVGGGGGGAGAESWKGEPYYGTHTYFSSGGGGGYLNYINNMKFNSNNNINIVVGYGGSRGNYWNGNGGAGGTSYIEGYKFSANGGSGGIIVNAYAYGIGFGNGGNSLSNGKNSGSSLAGGGGGGTSRNGSTGTVETVKIGGYPYGGNSGGRDNNGTLKSAEAGKGPGGGGGAGTYNDQFDGYGGAGAAGICKLNIVNY